MIVDASKAPAGGKLVSRACPGKLQNLIGDTGIRRDGGDEMPPMAVDPMWELGFAKEMFS
jgi:hypothetical protein